MNSSYLRSEDLCSIPLRASIYIDYLDFFGIKDFYYPLLIYSIIYLEALSPGYLFHYFMLECNAIYLVQFFPV